MNTKDYTYLLNKPYSLNERQTAELEKILSEFPFLQSARAIYLKGLYNQDSFRYNTELKKTAAYTTDRSVLFDFITSEQFQSVDKDAFIENEKAVQSIAVNDSEVLEAEPEIVEVPAPQPAEQVAVVDKLEESIKQSIKAVEEPKPSEPSFSTDTDTKLEESIKKSIEAVGENKQDEPELLSATQEKPQVNSVATTKPEEVAEETAQKLEIGKPLEFSKQETHSFAEWLKLSKLTPINREEEMPEVPKKEEKTPEIKEPISKKMELIDKFIETNPKIAPVKNSPQSPVNIERSTQDNSMLMTETLARVYLEQKKYSKAIQAYQILILKYPEKSVFFADRISDIKIIQQNNNLKNDA
ncbi:hypothetical protein AMR72_06935 [Flavobacterium psychrophilum]|nr:hypothetical protein AMR72_06935 [Flavobacterium psychrophilum]AOE52266.1 hypothetical protein ALW18_06925 [Flavobacterium psychrophilum]